MNAAVGLMDGLGLDGDRCIRVIPRQEDGLQNSPFSLCCGNPVFFNVAGSSAITEDRNMQITITER